jgi:DNA-binding transcriptional MerR regulator
MSKSTQAFRTIREVADWLDVAAHVLRFWESKFPQIKPVKRAGGRRYYRPADMELVGGIKVLLHDRGLTIRGVQKMIREDGVAAVAALSPPVDLDGMEIDEAEADAGADAIEDWIDATEAQDQPADQPVAVAPEAEAEPAPAPEPEPEPEPETTPELDLDLEPVPQPAPEPAVLSAPEPTPAPTPAPAPNPATDPATDPAPLAPPATDADLGAEAETYGNAAAIAALAAQAPHLSPDQIARARPAIIALRDRLRSDLHNRGA